MELSLRYLCFFVIDVVIKDLKLKDKDLRSEDMDLRSEDMDL